MAAFDTPRSSLSSVGIAGRLTALTGAIFAGFAAWNDARATRETLAKLDERTLEDIGLTRGDIDRLTLF